MKVDLQRKIDQIVGGFLCRVLSLRMQKDADVKIEPKRILIILLSEMGSLVLARPMFNHIKNKYPKSLIYVMLFEQNREFLEILEVVPPENIITVRNSSLFRLLKDSVRVLIKLRQITVDTVIDCELFSRISSLYSFFSGAKLKVGFHPYNQEGLYRGSFINRPVLYNPYNHISQQFITLAEAIDSEMVPKAKRKITMDSIDVPDIEIDKQEIDNFFNKARTDFSINEDRKLVLIYPGGGLLPIRAWPLENYCLVVKDLIEKGFAVGIVGVENDKKLADEILSSCQSRFCMDFTGYTKTVKELMVMFHFTSLLITNDGGPGHFASMTPVPVITLYGPETPMLYGALSPKSYNFYIPLSCSPCLSAFNHRNSPCDGNNLCLKYIRPEDVLAKAYKMIEDMGMN